MFQVLPTVGIAIASAGCAAAGGALTQFFADRVARLMAPLAAVSEQPTQTS